MRYCGEEATLDDLRENINNLGTGFQTITKDDNISDIIVKTTEGYLFEAYFDEILSEYHVEYMGEADSSYIPEVNITYDEVLGQIEVNATTGNISKISITSNAEEVASGSSNILTYTVTNSGLYIVTIETKEGITRYGYIDVSLKKDILIAPGIEIAAGTEGTNGWYKTEVNVSIDPSGTNGQKMKYKLVGATSQEETEITNMSTTTVITISNAGLTKVVAWVEYEEEGKTYKSDYSYYNVKIDNVAPNTPTASISATEGNEVSNISTYWYKSTVEVEITAEDENSGIYGYTYSITGTKNVSETSLIGTKQKITFETDGTFTLIIKAIDKAGNISNAYTLTVYKDSTEPNEFVPNISNVTNNSFTISAYTVDATSGIAKYEYYVNNDKKYEGTDNTYTVTGLTKDTTYGVYVVAYDNAGNARASSSVSVYTSQSTSGSTGEIGAVDDGTTIGYGTYTLTYDANGGMQSSVPDSRTFIYAEEITLSTVVPRYDEDDTMGFIGWSTDPYTYDKIYYAGSDFQAFGNVTLYAVWTTDATVIFDANGGDYTPSSVTFQAGESITLPTSAGTYYGSNSSLTTSATLLGWSTTKYTTSAIVEYEVGTQFSKGGTTVLYAVWDLGCVVKFTSYGTKTPANRTFANGSSIIVPTAEEVGTYSSNSKAEFVGWSTTAYGSFSNPEMLAGEGNYSTYTRGTTTLYGIWKASAFLAQGDVVSYEVPGGTTSTYGTSTYTGYTSETQSWTVNAGTYSFAVLRSRATTGYYTEIVPLQSSNVLIITPYYAYNYYGTISRAICNLYYNSTYAYSSRSVGYNYNGNSGLYSTHASALGTLYYTYGFTGVYGSSYAYYGERNYSSFTGVGQVVGSTSSYSTKPETALLSRYACFAGAGSSSIYYTNLGYLVNSYFLYLAYPYAYNSYGTYDDYYGYAYTEEGTSSSTSSLSGSRTTYNPIQARCCSSSVFT